MQFISVFTASSFSIGMGEDWRVAAVAEGVESACTIWYIEVKQSVNKLNGSKSWLNWSRVKWRSNQKQQQQRQQ